MAMYPYPNQNSRSLSDRLRTLQMERRWRGRGKPFLQGGAMSDAAPAVEPDMGQDVAPAPSFGQSGGQGGPFEDVQAPEPRSLGLDPRQAAFMNGLLARVERGEISQQDAVALWRQFRFGQGGQGAGPEAALAQGRGGYR